MLEGRARTEPEALPRGLKYVAKEWQELHRHVTGAARSDRRHHNAAHLAQVCSAYVWPAQALYALLVVPPAAIIQTLTTDVEF